MAGVKIDELPNASAITGLEQIPLVQNGIAAKGTPSQISTYLGSNLPVITSLGTVATGVWNATAIGTTYGGTGFTSYTAGDLLYAASSSALAKLNVGATGQVLSTRSGAVPIWAYPVINTRSFSADTTLSVTDGGGGLYHPATDTTARTVTIPANSSVSFPIGTVISIYNRAAAGAVNVQITTDTLDFPPNGGTGTRTIAASGIATLWKVEATVWVIGGPGVS